MKIETIIQETILNLENQHILIVQSDESFYMRKLMDALYVPAPKFNTLIGDIT